MKAIVGILLVLCQWASVVYAQDWDPYVLNQKSYYIAYDTSTMIEVLADLETGTPDRRELHFYTLPFYNDTIACINGIDSINRLEDWVFGQDSVVVLPDTIFIFSTTSPEEPFYLLKNAPIGASWDVPITYEYADIDLITVSFDSTGVIDLLGVTDSVRYYSLHTTDPQDNPLSLDHVRITLSKQHGFVEIVPIQTLLKGRNEYFHEYGVYQLAGFIADEDTFGLHITRWEDFIQLQPGDILKYRKENTYGTSYEVRYIQSVLRETDRIVVHYISGGYDGYMIYYTQSLKWSWLSRGDIYVVAPYDYESDTDYYDLDQSVAKLDDWMCNKDYAIDKISITKWYNIGYAIDLSFGCQVSEMMGYSSGYMLNSIVGMVSYGEGDYDYFQSEELVGSVIGGYAYGDYWEVDVHDAKNTSIVVYPNPAQSSISITAKQCGFDYKVFSFAGILVNAGFASANLVDVSDLDAGLYLLEIRQNKEIYVAKFVKE